MAPGMVSNSDLPQVLPETDLSSDQVKSPVICAQEIQDHPRGDEIRRQVEYYFSDANLVTDEYLLEACNGIENKPVSIKKICRFSKMRSFKPYTQVVAALRLSPFLNVSEDGKGISRKLPLRPYQLAGGDEDGDSDLELENKEGEAEVVVQSPAPQPKKFEPVKSTNPNITKNLAKPTGFEEYHAEGPITPAEYKDDQALFDPECSFSERIESAIQRFKVKKKLHQEHARIFTAFMKYGGVEIRAQFSGLDQKELKEKDIYELTRLMATHFVSSDKDDDELWVVDFVGVVSGFLSSQFPLFHQDYSRERVKIATQTIRTFYNYILHHNVCPEYNDQIFAARKICESADEELLKVQTVGYAFPGAFNVACSVLFGGYYNGKYIGNQPWALDGDQTANPHLFEYVRWTPGQGFSQKEAQIVMQTAVAAVGTYDQSYRLTQEDLQNFDMREVEDLGLEVVSIVLATPEVLALYAELNKEYQHKLDMRPLGKMVCKPWSIPDFTPHDISAAAAKKRVLDLDRTFEFWIEDEILEDCFVGMKLDGTIWKLALGDGIWILDNVREVYCSFFKWLPNELIMGDRRILREPQWYPHGRGGKATPSESGETQNAKEIQGGEEANDCSDVEEDKDKRANEEGL
ncbi:hypothetical protein EJ05DRAFT_478392 [Pseudovirgaria hyperparasitica]|uniref:HTH La-type RNA-binding domain-containing protein n=1 Tax=Pseudovirgaria hyperparasitica TaxID=470096 RepID=A0A6A6VYS0_9PEZI|nr:uncharacterized protein EJ05DRAFT_478392 [Pseudovirgaria hyperparasitica]KAF2755375.1 hypothetical protein EJ05DRAFT_478392 [Pseudovirgaria hyperparasitica]